LSFPSEKVGSGAGRENGRWRRASAPALWMCGVRLQPVLRVRRRNAGLAWKQWAKRRTADPGAARAARASGGSRERAAVGLRFTRPGGRGFELEGACAPETDVVGISHIERSECVRATRAGNEGWRVAAPAQACGSSRFCASGGGGILGFRTRAWAWKQGGCSEASDGGAHPAPRASGRSRRLRRHRRPGNGLPWAAVHAARRERIGIGGCSRD
jgi:hypothetical protein